MSVVWIPEAAHFSTTSNGIGPSLRAAAIAARLAADEDLVGRRLLLQKLLASVRGRYLTFVVQVSPSTAVSAAFAALIAAVDGLDAVAPDFSGFPAIAAAARACRARAWAGVPLAQEEDVVEIVVDFAELAMAETEAAASEAAYRLASRWTRRDDGAGECALRAVLTEHPLE